MTIVDEAQPHILVEVVERRREAEDVVTLRLAPSQGGVLPRWQPGAHIDLISTPELVRQYSLCGSPGDHDRYTVAVRVEANGRGGSLAVGDLEPGQSVRISHPRNHFELVDVDSYLFIAGGIGITPLLPMIEQVSAAGATWSLVYGGRTRSSMPFLDNLMARHGDAVDAWDDDSRGPIDVPRVLSGVRADDAIYCCGPEPLMEAVEQSLAPKLRDTLHLERFRPRPHDPSLDEPFEVELAATGRTVVVPADRSIMDVLEGAGVTLPFSCREGTCGTCETKVLAGAIDHRDSVLSPAEREAGDYMMLCVSRSAGGRLVIDR